MIMVTQEIAGSYGLFWIQDVSFEYQNHEKYLKKQTVYHCKGQ